MITESLLAKIDRGREGKNQGLSIGLEKLEEVIDGVTQGTYTLIYGGTGSGKTTFTLFSHIYMPLKFHLDDGKFHSCNEACKTCNTQGNSENHNCLTCNENFPFIIEKNNKFNCVSNCSYYYYKKENNYYCTKELNCTVDYPKLKPNSRECTDMIDAGDIMANIVPEEAGESKLQQINYYNNLIQYIDNSFTSPKYDTTNIENGKDEIIKTDQMTVTFTTTENQKNNLYNNMTSIDLGECETLLRNFYNISDNETLYMKKIDIIQDGMKTVKVEFDVYR